jgi:hypothetical protein
LNVHQQLVQRSAVKFLKPLRQFACQHGAAIAEYGAKGRQEFSDPIILPGRLDRTRTLDGSKLDRNYSPDGIFAKTSTTIEQLIISERLHL